MSHEQAGGRVFDFMDAETLNVNYRLWRVVLMANDGRGGICRT